MARKKRKKDRSERNPEPGSWSSTSLGDAEEHPETAVEESVATGEAFPADIPPLERVEVEPASPQEHRGQQVEPDVQPAPAQKPEGFFEKIARWLQGPEQPIPSVAEPVAPPPAPIAAARPSPVPIEPPPSPERVPESVSPQLAAPRPFEETIPPRAERAAPPPRPPSETVPPSKIDHILAVLTLERVMPELDAARRELEGMKISSNARLRQLEAERDQFRTEAEKFRAEHSDTDSRAAMLRQSLEAQEQRLQEAQRQAAERLGPLEAERDHFRSEAERLRIEVANAESRVARLRQSFTDEEQRFRESERGTQERVRQLEAERDERQAEMEGARAEEHNLTLRIRQLEAMLDIQQTSRRTEEDWKQFESRVQALEEELEAARRRVAQEQEEAKARVQQIEAERDHLASSLSAKETERDQLAAELAEKEDKAATSTRRAKGESNRVRELEAELTRLRQIEAERDQLAAELAAKENLLGSSRQTEGESDRLRELEAELAEWKARAAAEPEAPPSPEAGAAGLGADTPRLLDLHQQTMSRLTVILACADLLAMNPRVDAKIRDLAREIRSEGQLLSQIIKRYTLPPDTKPSE